MSVVSVFHLSHKRSVQFLSCAKIIVALIVIWIITLLLKQKDYINKFNGNPNQLFIILNTYSYSCSEFCNRTISQHRPIGICAKRRRAISGRQPNS